jgi:hypothetical protein
MSQSASIPTCRPPAFFPLLVGVAFAFTADAGARLGGNYGNLPLQFEANQGQTHPQVKFLCRGRGYSLYLTASEAVVVLSRAGRDANRVELQTDTESIVLRMALVGAASDAPARGFEELPGKANYLTGRDRSNWRTSIPTYAKVRYRNVYPGIDLVYYGSQRRLEHDFIVAAGAEPGRILMRLEGVETRELDAQGDLVLHLAGAIARLRRPSIYQEVDGIRREVDGGYVLMSADGIGLRVGEYDRSRPLVIDSILLYSTFLGGGTADYGYGIVVDAHGNAYVTGNTTSADFPTSAGAFQTMHAGNMNGDVFVTKVDPAGSAVIFSTYLGGGDYEYGAGIAVDAKGSAYVTGYTRSSDFPTTAGAFQTAFAGPSGGGDAFVTKIDPTGTALAYSTYLGGSGDDVGEDPISSRNGIAVDADGNAYVTGDTRSADFPTTAGAFRRAFSGGFRDAFVTKLDASGSAPIYSTFLGALTGRAVAVDAARSAYVTGETCVQGCDAHVTKLDPTGSAVVYSVALGGSRSDEGRGIAVDADGKAYVTGATRSADFPTTPSAFQRLYGGGADPHGDPYPDAFVAKLDPSGSVLVYSTFLGGSGPDLGRGIAVDADGNAYVTGSTGSMNFPTTPEASQPTWGGGPYDAFVAKLGATGVALSSTYLGGSSADYGEAIAADRNGDAYATGWTTSDDFPTTAGTFQPVFSDPVASHPLSDAFVTKIIDTPLLAPPQLPRGTQGR